MPFKFFGEKIMFLERRIHFLSSSYASEIKIPKLSNITTIIFHKIHKAHIATGKAKITQATTVGFVNEPIITSKAIAI